MSNFAHKIVKLLILYEVLRNMNEIQRYDDIEFCPSDPDPERSYPLEEEYHETVSESPKKPRAFQVMACSRKGRVSKGCR
jgi:hypothetical protein